MTMTHTPVDNGVNVEALLGVRDALADTPEIIEFHRCATGFWIAGTHSRSSVDTFYGFGEQQQHKGTFTYDADHPSRLPRRTTASRLSRTSWWP